MKKLYTIFFLSSFISVNLFAITYHVKSDGKDTNNGLSVNTAFKTIQTATNKVQADYIKVLIIFIKQVEQRVSLSYILQWVLK